MRDFAGFIKPRIYAYSRLSHPHTVFSIRIFLFPVIRLRVTPKFQTDRKRTARTALIKLATLVLETSKQKGVHGTQTCLWAVSRRPTTMCPQFLRLSDRSRTSPLLISTFLWRFHAGIPGREMLMENIMFSLWAITWTDAEASRCKRMKPVSCMNLSYLLLSAVYANQVSSSMLTFTSGLFPAWLVTAEMIALRSISLPALLTFLTWLSLNRSKMSESWFLNLSAARSA